MSLFIFQICSLIVIMVLGLMVVRVDRASKRIPNDLLKSGLIAAGVLLGLGMISRAVSPAYVINVAGNGMIAFCVSLMIWKMKFWPAGDAKFFTVLAILVPLHFYHRTYLPYFPAFALLINIFIVYFVFILIKFVLWTARRFVMVFFRPHFVLKFCRRRFREIRRNIIKTIHNRAMLAEMMSGMLVRKLLRRSVKIVLVSAVALLITHRGRPIEPVTAVKTFSVYFVLFWAARTLFEWFVKFSGQKRISCRSLRQGMNLSEQTIRRLKKDREFFESVSDFRAEGLSEHQAVVIREYLTGEKISSVYVYETIPFSPFLVLGVVLTVSVQGALIVLLRGF